jgi:aminoglycoside phosphotransferase (APT) family kinase protein
VRSFADRLIPYLTAAQRACGTVMEEAIDPPARRKLEQVCEVLSALTCEARVASGLEAQALHGYRRLLPQAPEGFAAAKGRVAAIIGAQDGSRDIATAEFCRAAVAIDAELLQALAQGCRAECRAPAQGVKEDASGGLPDTTALADYLSRVFGRPVEISAITTASLGYSKATYLLDIRSAADVPQSLVIRMDRPFNFLGTTVIDEYPILATLFENGVSVPRPYALERTGAVLGQPFLIVSRVRGRNVGSHFSFPPRNPDLCRELGARLAQIHRIAVASFAPGLRGTAESAEEQITAEIARYYADWSALGAVSPTIESAFRWIRAHAHDAIGARTLVHGDFSLSNVMISEEGTVSAILDWEFAQWGFPAADIGWFFTAAEHLASWEEFLGAYRSAGGSVPAKKQLDFFVLWGMLRLAVMNCQVETAFEEGRMPDIRHACVAISFSRQQMLRVAAYLSGLLAIEAAN